MLKVWSQRLAITLVYEYISARNTTHGNQFYCEWTQEQKALICDLKQNILKCNSLDWTQQNR